MFAVGFQLFIFFFNKVLDSMSLSDETQSCCTRLPVVGRSAKKTALAHIFLAKFN